MKSGFEAYAWQMSSDSCLGRIDHIINIVSECGGQGIEPEVCMLGDYVEDLVKLK